MTKSEQISFTRRCQLSCCQCIHVKISLHMWQGAHQARSYPGFHSMEWLGIFLVHHRAIPPLNSLLSICTPGWEGLGESSVLSKNTTQYPWPGLKPRLLDDQESSTLTMRLPSSLGTNPGQGHNVAFLGETIYSDCASLHPGVQIGTSS